MSATSSNTKVFVSFERDTHKTFIDSLCTALVQAGLSPLISDKQAILESRICIVVLSKNYASSVYCLDELVTILEYRKIGGTVLPVFCDVDPSEVRRQTGSTGEAFNLYIEKVIDKETDFQRRKGLIQNLKAVLTEVADMAGFVLQNRPDSDEPRLIRSVVDFIQDELKSNKISSWGNNVCELMDSGLSKLPNDMVFPVLKELFLQDNKYILAIPPSFFHFMPSLKVLDMSRTSIKKLPSSISKLVKLQKLFLRDCKLLMELPPEIQDLKNLRLFDLSGTELIYIPVEIKHLLKLKFLRMSLCASADEYISEINESIEIEKRIEIIPKNTLRKLLNLQELSIFVDLNCKWWGAIAESIILDLVRLKKLQILKLYFPTVHIFQRLLEHHVVCESLSDFRFVVGHEDQHVISRFFSQELQDEFETLRKCLKYVNGTEDINEVANACKYAGTLFLDRHWSIERLSVLKNSCDLRFCVLVECNKMKNVIDGHDLFPEDDNEDMGDSGKPAILSLQYLSIHYMKNLTSIWVGPFPSGCLNNLQLLALSTCPNVKTIFDDRLLCNLLNLKELIVEDCPKVESLVSVESSYLKYDKVFLPCLEKITLLFLPELVSISRGLEIAPRLVRMVVYDCPKLQTLSSMEVCSKNIKEIKGESKWWEALERSNNQLDVFVPLGGDGLMNQLSDARISRNTLSIIQVSDENEVVAKAKNMQVLSKNLIKKVGDLIVIGFESHLQYLKSMLIEDARTVVVISAPGGYGKTVLARMIRKDDDIRGIFGEIFFACVSDEPYLKAIIENIFRQKGRTPPKFESDEDAIIQLESLMIEICPDRVLLVLDDVLPEWEPLVQKLIFQIPGYRILVTTRYTFRQFEFYRLPKLNNKDATTLFCHSAFPQATKYDIPSFLLNKIVGCCNGIPLVLVLVGRCLFEQPEAVWFSVLERLSERDVSIDHLESCINVLGFLGENSMIKEHYLDLGSFPKNKPIQASALMDMWMEIYKLDEMTTSNNYKPLLELLSRNLVKRGPMSQLLCGNDLKLELGLAREFGIGKSSKEPVELLRRLILDIRGNELPKWWNEETHKFLSARLLSITTDGTFSSNWFETQLPEVRVMILTFSSSSYSLPDFMEGMDELKALIISNHNYHSVELNNFQQVRHLCNLRRITLRNILLPSLGEILVQMTNLRKITLLMCKMTEATEVGTEKIHNFPPNLEEISIEHCDDMLKVPAGLCSILHLKKLNILYCYELVELPDEIGSLTNLESLNLSGCGRLKMLPESIGDLKKLEVLDVSHCLDMKLLPSRLGELNSLIKLSIQGCYGLYDVPPSFKDLAQLKNVVCSEEIFQFIKDVHPSAIIEVHKEPIDLDWLHNI